ncbi:PefC/AfrB family outer membrane usher protein [Pantoea sp. y20]
MKKNIKKFLVLTGGCLLIIQSQASELNLDFIQGDARKNIPDIYLSGMKNMPGKYLTDVYLNDKYVIKSLLDIRLEDAEELCLDKKWLKENVPAIKQDELRETFDAARQCYYPARLRNGAASFDPGTQRLELRIPQKAINDPASVVEWDYGVPGMRLGYSANISKNFRNEETLWGKADLNANLGRWVFSMEGSALNHQGSDIQNALLTTALPEIHGKFALGKGQTGGSLVPGFRFYGASLYSDRSMLGWQSRGYAPVIAGVANTSARITVTQGGYTLLSEVVSPGEYRFNNLVPVGSGDITVVVEEENGEKRVTTYPVTTLPTLLRAGDINYTLSAGSQQEAGRVAPADNPFALANVDYGFEPLTLSVAGILSTHYQSAGAGITRDWGMPGALALSLNSSRSEHMTQEGASHGREGISFKTTYAKGLTDATSLQLSSYHYRGKGYEDFADFAPRTYSGFDNENRRERFQVTLTHNLDKAFISASSWLQTYRGARANETGANLALSTSLNRVTVGTNLSYQHNSGSGRQDVAGSLNVSVPFSLWGRSYSSSSAATYDARGRAGFSSGASGSLNDRMNYGVSASTSPSGGSQSAWIGAQASVVNLNASLTKSRDNTAVSGSISGSAVATAESGLLLTRETNNTLAVVKIKDIPGVRFNGSQPTNRQGITVTGVSPYNSNNLTIESQALPDSIDLLNSVNSFTPTENAIVFREFGYVSARRYILKVTDRMGVPLTEGSQADTAQGQYAGFVSRGGLLLVNALEDQTSLSVSSRQGEQCQINMQGIQANDNQIHEVKCE